MSIVTSKVKNNHQSFKTAGQSFRGDRPKYRTVDHQAGDVAGVVDAEDHFLNERIFQPLRSVIVFEAG